MNRIKLLFGIISILLLLIVCGCNIEVEDEGNYTLPSGHDGSASYGDEALQAAEDLRELIEEAEQTDESESTSLMDIGVVDKVPFCGWASVEYSRNTDYENEDHLSYSDESQMTFYSMSGYIISYDDGSVILTATQVDVKGGYKSDEYSENKIMETVSETNIGYGATKISGIFEGNGIKIGSIEEDRSYTLGFSPGYTGESHSIITTRSHSYTDSYGDTTVDTNEAIINMDGISIGGGDEICEQDDPSSKAISLIAKCKYFATEGGSIAGSYLDSYSDVDEESTDIAYGKIKWAFHPIGSSLEYEETNLNPEDLLTVLDRYNTYFVDSGAEEGELEEWYQEYGTC